MTRRGGVGVAVLLLPLLAAPRASGKIPIVETDAVRLGFGGYARFMSSWVDIELQGAPDDGLSLLTSISRAELSLSALGVFAIEVHGRVLWSAASLPLLGEGAGIGLGAGVTVAPPSSVDLRWTLAGGDDAPWHRVDLDLDRLALRLFLGDVDLTLGRQAITWGNSQILLPADLWTAISPFDQDSSQKRGIDAARAVWSLGAGAELDFLVVDRGSVEDLSGGVRAVFYRPFGDVWVGAAKSYEQVGALAGVAAEVGPVKLRAEGAAFYDLHDSRFQRPRMTLGVDWFQSADFLLSGEAHYSGLDGDPGALGRGEIYLTREWYLSLLATWKPHDLVSLTLLPIANVQHDPSAMIVWTVGYEVAQDVDLGVGAYHGVGAAASEFGALKHMVFLQLAAFL